MAFNLPELPYPPQALEPNFDSRTMEIHHGKHHAGYTNNLNAAIKDTPLENQSIEEILGHLDMNNMPLRNNAGGYYNHCLFWEILSPHGGMNPKGELADSINETFGSFDQFKEKFTQAAMSRFGSGWAWLCINPSGTLEICSTPNQDNPLMPNTGCGGKILMGIDVWEHAYYLHYQNRRADYIAAFFNLLNWEFVEDRYAAMK